MRPGFTALLIGGWLAGCASVPPGTMPPRASVTDFALEARFALRVNLPDQAAHSAGGRLSWHHKDDDNHILIANPLGFGMAEIDTTRTLSRLHTADGKIHQSTDPEDLIEQVTGQRLPVSQLPAWLLGRPSASARIETDLQQRPSHLHEAGWQIDYSYDNDAATALPSGLNLRRDSEIELRLRIEEWKTAP